MGGSLFDGKLGLFVFLETLVGFWIVWSLGLGFWLWKFWLFGMVKCMATANRLGFGLDFHVGHGYGLWV